MCSFLCTNLNSIVSKYNEANRLLKLRGPDLSNIVRKNGYYFLHNLLSMTGEFVKQPFVDQGVVCLYNGEIYNHGAFGSYKSDGECLIPLYRDHGPEFIKKMDGEFAIVIFDFEKNIIVISSDVFRTKPLFVSIKDGKFGCSTFKTPLEILGHEDVEKFPPNTTRVYDLETLSILSEDVVFCFNIDQFKDSFED